MIKTIETGFKNFIRLNKMDAVNTIFREYKKYYRMQGYKYQLSVYGAVKINEIPKAVRIEILFNDLPKKKDIIKISDVIDVIKPIGFSLAYFHNGLIEPIVTQTEIERGL